MTPAEQAAFVKAYGSNVAHHPDSVVADFVARHESDENFEYSFEQVSIMDALGMWHDAIKWKLEQLSGTGPR
jgi:hypothetical protein